MARTKRNDDELRAASDHLYYEIQMLRSTMALLATGAFGESILSNALIESFTIHARALIHFLYPRIMLKAAMSLPQISSMVRGAGRQSGQRSPQCLVLLGAA